MTPLEILKQSMEIYERKSMDYQNPNSTVKQADYYPRGIETLYDIMWCKMLRIRSLMEHMKSQEESCSPQFESIQDSCIDLINYSSFLASYMSRGITGQDPNRDFFNQPIQSKD
jgi:hypothetical protein